MKQILNLSKLVLVVTLLLTVNQAFSAVLTVSNNTNISAQYTSVPAAISAAANGDTIYIHGSNTAYGDITINKQLVVIGPGYIPTNPTGLRAMLGYIYLDTLTGVSGSSGTYIAGLYFSALYINSHYNGLVLNNITVRRNQITSYLQIGSSNTEVHNWLILENLISNIGYNINIAASTNILVNNNIISYMYNAYKSIYVNDVIYYIPNFSECTISNCIFVATSTTNNTVTCTFNNNLFSSSQTFNYPASNTFSPANQATNNHDPLFVGGSATSYLSISDYHLQATSFGHTNPGTDGKDLGIYGGTGFLWGGTPPVPMIYFYNLKPNYVQSNGTLNITVSVKNQ
jgi:hypothetical protein